MELLVNLTTKGISNLVAVVLIILVLILSLLQTIKDYFKKKKNKIKFF